MIVEIPMFLPKELDPNYHGHWRRKAEAAKSLRGAAYVCALNCSKFSHPEYKKAELSITLVVPNQRHFRDADNALASLKPAIDGCVDAGIILGDDDDHLRYRLPILYEVDKSRAPLIILEFKEV